MRTYVLLTATAALALGACAAGEGNEAAGGNTAGAAENATASANESASSSAAENASAPAAATAGAAPSREFVVGRWGEEGDCALAVEFRADGTMDGPFDGWSLDGNRLTMVGNPQVMTLTVIDQNTMQSVGADGRARRITRC